MHMSDEMNKIDKVIRQHLLDQGMDVEDLVNEMIEEGYLELDTTDKDISYGRSRKEVSG